MKKVYIIFIVLIIFYFLFSFFVNKVILPRYIAKIESKLSQLTNAEVTFKNPKLGWGRLYIGEIEFSFPSLKPLYFKDIKTKFSLIGLLRKKYKITFLSNFVHENYPVQSIWGNLFYSRARDFLKLRIVSQDIDLACFSKILKKLYPNWYLNMIKINKGIIVFDSELQKEGNNFSLEIDSQFKKPLFSLSGYNLKLDSLKIKGEVNNFSSSLNGEIEGLTIANRKNRVLLTKGNSHFKIELPQRLSLNNFNFYIKDIPWQANLELSDLGPNFKVLLSAQSENYQFNLTATKRKGLAFNIDELELDSDYSHIKAQGEITQKKGVSLQLYGNGDISLKEIANLFPQPILKKLQGEITVDSFRLFYPFATGNYLLDLNASSPNLFFENRSIAHKANFNIRVAKEAIIIESLNLKERSGILKAKGSVSASGEKLSQLELKFQDYPVRNIAYFFNKKENQKGKINGEISFSGFLGKKNSYHGKGKWTIDDAEIANIDLLGPIADLIGLPEFKEIKFNSCSGKLKIVNEKFYLINTKLNSPNLKLYLDGDIGFDKNLNLIATTKFHGIPQGKRKIWSQISKYIWQTAGEFFYKIRITGTVDNPHYQIIPSPIEQMLNKIPFFDKQ